MKPNKRSSRLLALALSLVLSLSLSLPALAAGEDDIIYIHTAKDLCALSDSCAYDAWSRGKTVLLTADISLRGVDFEPIASFSGTFNGGGHTISGLTLDIDGIALVFRFVPSVSGEGYEWSASCAPDNNGLISVETTTDGGICTVRLLNVPRYGGVTLSATVTNGAESRSICLATDIRAGENSISWDPQV